MVFFSPSFYYIRLSVLRHMLQSAFGQWNWKLWLLSILFIFLYSIHLLLSLFFRLLDEIFHRGYKTTPINQPVFIIANPRSGTTYLHRLLALDDERFVYTKNAHTFFMSSSFVQFYQVIRWTDRHLMFNALRKLMKKLDEMFWGGWDDIHPMGFNKAEEDELVFAQTFNSPGMFIPFPIFHENNHNRFLDDEPETIRHNVIQFYASSIKRFVFRAGKKKTYLAKNVMSTGRYKTLLQAFPDAKIIYIARHPYDAVPSMASMFTVMYQFHSPNVPKRDISRKVWANYGIEFFQYAKTMHQSLPKEQFASVKYDDLLREPHETIKGIYRHFGWPMSEQFLTKLHQEKVRQQNYQSKHEYSLEEFGLSAQEVYNELSDVMDEFGFEKEF